MKLRPLTLIGLAVATLYGLSSCNDEHDHAHNEDGSHPHEEKDGHDHDKEGDHKEGDGHEHDKDDEHKHAEGDDHDHEKEGEHKHAEGDGHDHEKEGEHEHAEGDDHDHEKEGEQAHHVKKPGPSGGRVLHEYEPHAEFFVLDDRKVRITFVNDDYKPIPAAAQVASVIAGDRSSPTMLSFVKVGDVLISDKALPASDNFPVIVQIAAKDGDDPVMAKFQADMLDCPSCDYLEYACICDHGDGHEGHDHGEGGHKHD